MGYIKLKYKIFNQIVPTETIIKEIEYGSTFALYNNREEIIPCKYSSLKWVKWSQEKDEILLEVEDSFFRIEYFFEEFITIFIYNILDFGELQLVNIDISHSIIKEYIYPPVNLTGIHEKYLKGTIYKPYYHLSLIEKLKQTELFVENGINILKNDECYFKSKSQLIEETRSILKITKNRTYFVPNLTGYISDYIFIEQLIDIGVEIIMIDFLVSGFNSVFRLKEKFPNIKIWGHRVGYHVLQKYVSMQVISILALISGIDLLHIGTPTSINVNDRFELMNELLRYNSEFLPIFTKTTPEILRIIMPIFKKRAVYLSCGYFRNNIGEIDWMKVKQWSGEFYYK